MTVWGRVVGSSCGSEWPLFREHLSVPFRLFRRTHPAVIITMSSDSPAAVITSAPIKKLAVYGLGQFGFAMTKLFSDKHPSIPIEAYDPVEVRTRHTISQSFRPTTSVRHY